MPKKKRIDLRHHERALLTDTLPYETPIFFSNANFAAFAHSTDGPTRETSALARILLATTKSNGEPTRPYAFAIGRPGSGERFVSIPHPRSQHAVALLYRDHAQMIVNLCGRSPYSLRYPSRVATHYLQKQHAMTPQTGPKSDQPDEDPAGFRDQSRWASTYFSYREYGLSHKFFGGQEFSALEQRHALLRHLDVSRCFNSIYTHSIEWSFRGKEFAKRNLGIKGTPTFESQFDRTIRHGNWDETHGILIGPEYSRIFAEIILGAADVKISRAVESLASRIVIRRYVDDYFIFSNSTSDLDSATSAIADCLREFNLALNESKTSTTSRPFMSLTAVSRANAGRIVESLWTLLDERLSKPTEQAPSAILSIRNLAVREIRANAALTQRPYSDIASYALTAIERQLENGITRSAKVFATNSPRQLLLAWLTTSVDLAAYLYSMDARANTSVKLARILRLCHAACIKSGADIVTLSAQMLDLVRSTGAQTASSRADRIAKINLLVTVDSLIGRHARLEQQDVESLLGLDSTQASLSSADYFALMAALFLARRRIRMSALHRRVVDEIKRRLTTDERTAMTDAETSLLLVDFLACPHVDETDKIEIAKHARRRVFGGECDTGSARQVIETASRCSFVEWDGENRLTEMLARKELTPAYE